MRTVNIVKNGVTTNANVVARTEEPHYHNGEKYFPCLLNGQWTNVRSSRVVFIKENRLGL